MNRFLLQTLKGLVGASDNIEFTVLCDILNTSCSQMESMEATKAAGYSRWMLPALGLAVFSAWLITVAFQLLLIDVAQTFQVSVGTAGLTAAVGSLSGIVAGLLLSILSVRYNHKLFVIIGLVGTAIAALVYFFSPTFDIALSANIGVGAGIALTSAMAYSYVGEFYPLQKRGRAMGWIVAAMTLSFVVGAPIVGLMATSGGWRSVMIWLSLPFTLFSLILVFLAVPNRYPKKEDSQIERFFTGCKQALSNPSALACLVVSMLTVAEGSIAFYSISFFRDQFQISIDLGSVIIIVGSILSSVGGITAGLFVNRIGRKPLGTIACLVAAVITIIFTFMPTFELSWGLNAVRFWFAGMASTALGSLVIEQVPKFRATMSSLNATFVNVGMLLASIAAGITLNLYNYQTMALILGSLGVAGVILWVALVKDTSTN
jgi:DHA1 family inner membrane transport protein